MKITERELCERKERILHEAFRLFCEKGIDRVSIRDIAAGAEVSEKSVYRYFNTKLELLIATIAMLWKEIVSELSTSIDEEYTHKTGFQQIEILLQGFRNLFEHHSEYVLFSYDYKLFLVRHSATLTVDEYNDVLHPMQELYIRALEKGMDDGSIRTRGDANDLYIAIWGLLRGYVVKIVIYDRMYEQRNLWSDRFDIACSLILGGLRCGADLPG